MSDTTNHAGTLETREDAGKGGAGLVSLWLDAISLASREEEDWREQGDAILRIYRDDDYRGAGVEQAAKRKFNILYANTETLAPAVYNSTPVPDVRRRFKDTDPVGKVAAQILERCITYSLDVYGFDARLEAAVKDTLLPGRGVVRIRYEPVIGEDGGILSESVSCEAVDWHRFRRGPGKFWDDVPWVAFEHFLTREEFIRLNKKVGTVIDLDCSISDRRRNAGDPEPEMLKRGRVWEIWDKEKRQVLFIAPAFKEKPVLVVDDPLNLSDFFPVPRPLYAFDTPGNLVPVPVYRSYQGLAEDLEEVSRRIAALVRALKWRGAYSDPAAGEFLSKWEDADDGKILPLENIMAMQGGGLDKAFWFQPIDVLAQVLVQLYQARDQIKQTIYEVTGISDIVRGASMASETATAQQIKAQWGSLRVQKLQREVQRFARDLIRMKAEIIAEKFQPATIFAMAGMQLPSQAEKMMAEQQGQQIPQPSAEEVIQLLRSDTLRNYRVDIETDSTIRADLTGEQQNVAQFVQGFGTFIQAVGPAVQAGFVPGDKAAILLKSFARVFKLGREAEDAIEDLGSQPPPQQPDPAAVEQAAQQAQMQADMQKMQAEAQLKQMEIEAETQREAMRQQAETEREQMRIQAEDARHQRQIAAEGDNAMITALQGAPDLVRGTVDELRGLPQARAAQAAVSEAEQLLPLLVEAVNAPKTLVRDRRMQAVAIRPDFALPDVQPQTPLGQAIVQMAQQVATPKRIVRDANNRVVGVEPMDAMQTQGNA